MRALGLLVAVLVGCGGSGSGDDEPPTDARGNPPSSGVFASAITRVEIEIDYEAGQEPFTGPMLGFGDTFDLSATNLERLFAGTKQLTLPRSTTAMENIGAVADEELTVPDLVALAARHRDLSNSGDRFTYYIVFVSGRFATDSGVQAGVLGVSLGNGVIAMFKDVIRSASGVPNIARFVEQVTLVHEIAHAVGLVDNGVPLTSAHKDADHGAHCTDDRCVMFWQIEGANDAAAYVQQSVLTSDTIVFGDECLADVDALTGGP